MHIQSGNTETNSSVDSGSVCNIINKSLANAVVLNSPKSYWSQTPKFYDLKTFSNELIMTIVVNSTTVKCIVWLAANVNVNVVEDDHRPIMGRNLFPQLGRSLTQSKQLTDINQNQCLIRKQITLDFPGLISRVGKSLKHSVKSTFHKHFTPTYQTERRAPIILQPLVQAALFFNL